MLARWALSRPFLNFRRDALKASSRRAFSYHSPSLLQHTRPPTWSGKVWYRKDGTSRSKLKGVLIGTTSATLVLFFYSFAEVVAEFERDNLVLSTLFHIQRHDAAFSSLNTGLPDFQTLIGYFKKMLISARAELGYEEADIETFFDFIEGLTGQEREEAYVMLQAMAEKVHRTLVDCGEEEPIELGRQVLNHLNAGLEVLSNIVISGKGLDALLRPRTEDGRAYNMVG